MGLALYHMTISIIRVTLGISLGGSIAAILAILIPHEKIVGKITNITILAVQPIPKLILLPFIISLFGLTDVSKIAMLAVYAFFQIFICVWDSTKYIDREIILYMKTAKANHRKFVRHVIWPHSIPYLLTGLKGSFGICFAVLFMVESFASDTGIGYFLLDSWTRSANIEIGSCIFFIALAGILMFLLVSFIERKIVLWNNTDRSESI